MILEGFEVENWACIRKLVVADLPRSGVIVLHGPNRTGKSSLVQALRACLMDFASNSKDGDLTRYFPRGAAEKPTVTVTFSSRGATYRIKKQFGTNKSVLESRTAAGAWKVEADSGTEAHRRVCELVGSNDSSKKGLQQLLWLTQAEFRLPEPNKFDPGVQSQLRGILGVLETKLDLSFSGRVKKRWSEWHAGQRKVGKEQKLKEACNLSRNRAELEKARIELSEGNAKFLTVEALLRQCGDLEVQLRDLYRQCAERAEALKRTQDERERYQARIAARKLAEERYANVGNELQSVLDERQQRADTARRLQDAEAALEPAKRRVEIEEQRVRDGEESQQKRKADLAALHNRQRNLQSQANAIAATLRAAADADKLKAAKEELQRASDAAERIAAFEKRHADHPVPSGKEQELLEANRQAVVRLRAELDAAAMSLTVVPDPGAAPARLALDGSVPSELSNIPKPIAVRHSAELSIPHWGRIELNRGTGTSNLDEIEAELKKLDDEFADSVAAYGIAPTKPDAVDQLRRLVAEREVERANLKSLNADFKKLAPNGLEPLRKTVRELETKAKAATTDGTEPIPPLPEDLESHKDELDEQLKSLGRDIDVLAAEIENAETALGVARTAATNAKVQLAGCEASTNGCREELDRLRPMEDIERRLADAERDAAATQIELQQTKLTVEETTIEDRLAARRRDMAAIEQQIRDAKEKLSENRGRILGSENLHADRSKVAARVEMLAQLTEREELERRAVDRLHELFEECREKQLGTLMTPIHDCVLNWMRALEIGDYREVRFDDKFLPDQLLRSDGTAEFALHEESIGAQEQIGMLVRLALGSILTAGGEPMVAVLDDPLTHCDVGRLNTMRAILRRASEGDPHAKPPAGSLQIVVLTCHPEWFRDERATVIDLERSDVLQRISG